METTTISRTKFKEGDLVRLGRTPWAKQRTGSYPGIFKVRAVEQNHMILEFHEDNLERDKPGDVVHFGSTGDPRVSVTHFELV